MAIIMALLIAFSSVSFLAHFNSAIAERFNSAMGYFLGATLLSEASDALRRVRVDADKSKMKIAELELDIEKKKATIARKNAALLKASDELKKSEVIIRKRGTVIREKVAVIDQHKRKLATFEASGKNLEKKATKRFTKVALYDAAGEFLGWIPVLGDAASIGMTAGGIYEMCQMFKEIEQATTDLGVPYQVYTDTFCEKPVEKTKEIIAEKTGAFKDGVYATTTVIKNYASDHVPGPSSISARVQSMLNTAYKIMRRLYDAI